MLSTVKYLLNTNTGFEKTRNILLVLILVPIDQVQVYEPRSDSYTAQFSQQSKMVVLCAQETKI